MGNEVEFQKYINEVYREFSLQGLYELQGALLDENCYSKADLVEKKINEVVKPTSGDPLDQQAA